MFKRNRGFTLVELLVVIGVLGILAAGLLATIDPLEQLRKGADSNKKTTAQELVNALTRYYATRGVMPWSEPVNPCNSGVIPVGYHGDGGLLTSGCWDLLINQGELKTSFKEQINILKALRITQLGTGAQISIAACYDPEAKTESLRPETKYNNSGEVQAGCPAAGATCYWCAQ